MITRAALTTQDLMGLLDQCEHTVRALERVVLELRDDTARSRPVFLDDRIALIRKELVYVAQQIMERAVDRRQYRGRYPRAVGQR